MAGHSKWNNIKHKKGAEDAKRGKVFSMLAKQIKSAVKEGGSGDPSSNATLRPILDKARAANMPKSNIQRAIDRGLGKSSSGTQLQEVVYEGFAPGGVGVMIEAITDNANRTSADIRFLLSKHQGSLGSPGSAGYLFTREEGEYKPSMPMTLEDPTQIKQLEQLMDALREHDDVEDVSVSAVWDEVAE